MVSTFPPTPDTLVGLNPNNDAGFRQYSGFGAAVAEGLIATQAAIADGTGVKKTYRFEYDFAVHGGAVSPITLTQPDGPLPADFIIQNAFVDVITAFIGGALCEAALSSGEAADDLVASVVVTDPPWDNIAPQVTIPLLGTVSTWIKTTGEVDPVLTITVTAVTAGKFNLFVEGYVSA